MFGRNSRRLFEAVFLAVLILTAINMMVTPNAKAQTPAVTVLSYSSYIAPQDSTTAYYPGDLIVVGEVQNTGSSTIESVSVNAFAYDQNSSQLAIANNEAYGNNLLPGQKAPFYLEFLESNAVTGDETYIQYVTNITVVASGIAANQTAYSGLTIPASSLSASNSSGVYTVTGTLSNSGTEELGDVWVVATFYNASGTVVSCDFTNYLANSFAPGASASFSVTPIDNDALTSPIVNYTLLAQYAPYVATASPTPTASIQPSPSQSTSPTPTATSHNTQIKLSQATTYEIVIAIVVVLGVLIAIIFVRRRRSAMEYVEHSPPPPEELPPPPPPP